MALVVEDGTGLATAESYAAVVDFRLYYNNRAVDVSAFTDAQVEAYLRLATDYMVRFYRASWKGYRCLPTQALDWPRNAVMLSDVSGGFRSRFEGAWPYLVPNNIVPVAVNVACCILAYKAAQADGNDIMPDISRSDTVKSEKVDVIEVVYDTDRPVYTLFRSADLALDPYLVTSDGAGVALVRS